MSTHDKLARIIHKVESNIDKLRYAARDKLGRSNNAVIQAYLGFSTSEKIFVRGRVLQDQGTLVLDKDASKWRNLRAAIRALNSHEVPSAKLYLPEFDAHVTADEEGFFEVWLELSQSINTITTAQNYSYVKAILKNKDDQDIFETELPVAIPSQNASFGIISDIDDTVLQSDATRTLSMINKVLFENAQTRKPFAGVSELYQALTAKDNPIFYVSSSPWNLYEMLSEFLKLNNIPTGPLMLRDWGISAEEFLPSSHKNHKQDAITKILDAYSELPFILIGDSGQEDPEIYFSLLDNYPDRILAIYIRDVSKTERDEKIAKLEAAAKDKNVTLMLSDTSESVAMDAFNNGWITEEELLQVKDAVAQG